MHDLLETTMICFSMLLVFSPLIGFVLFLRYIKRKEKAVLTQFKQNNQQGEMS